MTNEIKSRVVGNLGHITLNRPKALNALTQAMCDEITRLMVAWENDPNIGAVLVDGSGDRAFCAGGDVILLHDSGKAGDKRAETFWRNEYALNDLIYRYKKPYITLIDGIVMGGGVGLSVHGRHRVAGNSTMFAMPETGIGYFPDVGGTFFLPRLGMAVGQWLGLTGARMKMRQVCEAGIANSFVPSDQHEALIEALGAADLDGSDVAVLKVMSDFVQRPPAADPIPKSVNAFSASSVGGILTALDADGSEWAQAQAENLRKKSPVALSVTFEAIRRGAKLSFRDAMSQELDISLGFLNTQDFYEGIRAQLIDKDRNPKWSAEDLSGVTAMEISRHFVPTPTPLKFLD
ncbi:MAG: enoyl-CoA hydratase/isomerase family protein [Hyphomonadaceae bacterium]|nr:enoyl-CoA hydratase/isomerase family protein [Hyphomonadaceae bacterium]